MTLATRIRARIGVLVAAIVPLSLVIGACVLVSMARAERAPQVLASPFGEHDGLQLVNDSAGTTALAWRATAGEGQSIGLAEIPAGGRTASPVETVASTPRRRLSAPVLAISPAGRVAVAWFEQRETTSVWEEDLLAVKVRERAPDGSWEAARTLWRAPAKPAYGSGSLVVAPDDSGDAAVLWTIEQERIADPKPLQMLVATRQASGTYTPPIAIDREAAETEPAIAVAPSGEVTALWARPWHTLAGALYAESWRAGFSPGGSPTLLDSIESPELHGISDLFRHLLLETSASGEQLAVWLKGQSGQSGRPYLVALRAAWRSPSGPFEAAQAVSPPGVEAREPALDLSSNGRALLAWSEIGAAGAGPLLNYTTASLGAPLAAGTPFAVTLNSQDGLGDDGGVAASWLPDGSALLAWDTGHFEEAEEVAPGRSLGPGTPIRKKHGEGAISSERLLLTGGESARPVLAWVGRSPSDFSATALRYEIGADLPAFAGPSTPSASLLGSRDLPTRGVAVKLQCPEACTAAITGTAYALRREDDENAAASAYARVGALTRVDASLHSAGGKVLRLRLERSKRKRFCRTARRGDAEAVEVTAVVRSPGAGARHVMLGEEPTSKGCGR